MKSSSNVVYHPKLTKPDRVVLQNLEAYIEGYSNSNGSSFNEIGGGTKNGSAQEDHRGTSAWNIFAMLSLIAFLLFHKSAPRVRINTVQSFADFRPATKVIIETKSIWTNSKPGTIPRTPSSSPPCSLAPTSTSLLCLH